MRIAFLGFGLIAGSIARAVRGNPATSAWPMAAWSQSGEGPARASAEGIVDEASGSPESAIEGADLIVLAAPATACLELMDRLAGPWRDGLAADALVTDVASTKAALLGRADTLGLRYVGGHPMAGLEAAGYASSTADLFAGRPWVVVPGAAAATGDAGRVADLAGACGATVIVMDADEHDRAVAAISHLPLVVAAALVEAVAGTRRDGRRSDWPVAAELAAGGWASATRLARGDGVMGAAIATTNATALAARIRDLRAVLDEWLAELERAGGPDEAALAARLETARAVLEAGR